MVATDDLNQKVMAASSHDFLHTDLELVSEGVDADGSQQITPVWLL